MIASAPVRIGGHRADDLFYGARCRGGIVILDAERDAYQGFYLADDAQDGVAGAIAEAFPGSAIRQIASQAPPISSGLGEPKWQDCEPDWSAQVRLRDIALFAAALLVSTTRFRTFPFSRLVRPPRRTRPTAPIARYRAAVARFRRMSAFLPFSMQCLFRSHFLRCFLRGYGLSADWIFGVSLFPFQAHCWLGVGRLTLLDRAEKTEDFVPILIVRSLDRAPA
jgi:hypothetical protein